ncbi:hypothetical protein PG996_006837 [Apiospora saccharicola]|uniref:Uncharacterized protein n=1 Tax=Apiospora saccharicola TaxID=335842 RepID=A0ABR1V948_9PEZI
MNITPLSSDSSGASRVLVTGSRTMSTKDGIELLKTETLMLSREVENAQKCVSLLLERTAKTLPYVKTLPVGTIDAIANARNLLIDVTRRNDIMQERLHAQEQDYLEARADPWVDYAENLRHRIDVSKVDLWVSSLVTEQTKEFVAFRTAQTVGAITISVGIILLVLGVWKASNMVMA